MADRTVLDILLASGKTFAGSDLERARNQAGSMGIDVGMVLLGMGLITEEELESAYGELYGLPYVPEADLTVQPEVARRIPEKIIKRYEIFPVAQEGEELWVAISSPKGLKAAHAFARQEAIRVQAIFITPSALANLMGIKSTPSVPVPPQSDPALARSLAETSPVGHEVPTDLQAPNEMKPAAATAGASPASVSAPSDRLPESGPVADGSGDSPEQELGKITELGDESETISIVSQILSTCIDKEVSDIHLSRSDEALVLRYRKDGVLSPQRLKMSSRNQEAVISRVKVLSEMDVTERRNPQDGAFEHIYTREDGRTVRYVCRSSVVPTRLGEKACIRLLEADARARSLDELGLSNEVMALVRRISKNPSGLLLFTGPTGSGKTTAAYGCLREISNRHVSVFTVEDPIEYTNDQYYQVQVHEKIGLSFARVLRAILRQDPDVILVGEIRDAETAQIGATAAMIGRLVLSTLHTNDAPGTINRLADLGVARYAIASALRGALAIRLLRRLCQTCKQTVASDSDELKAARDVYLLNEGQACRPVGCLDCDQTGFDGRVPVAEVMEMDPRLGDAVLSGQSAFEIRKTALESGFQPLLVDGWRRVLTGETSEREVIRQLGSVF